MTAVFVTGTDTGCGKTYISEFMLRGAKELGLKATGMKPVATGVDEDTGKNEDVSRLFSVSDPRPPLNLLNQYCFPEPVSPNIAAAINQSEINLENIFSAFGKLNRAYEFVVVEAVGGWRVPIGADIAVSDMAAVLDIPVLLVVGMELGCINHAILTAESLRRSQVDVVGWVANLYDADIMFPNEVSNTIADNLYFPLLHTVQKNPSLEQATCFATTVLEKSRRT